MKNFVKICLISFILIFTFGIVLCGSLITVNYIQFQKIPLNADALTSPSLEISLYSNDNQPYIEQLNGAFCHIEDLNEYTKQAFISIEDKDFYKHNGLNYKRIAKAMLNNIKSLKLKEGASTISQQLIKNTHLSGEKTFERKLKEMALTKKLEKNFNKENILESYLNIIFFGNNCYGLESASNYYFNKKASELNLNESCTLAGIIKSPTKYSPITNYKNCINRRNIVLSEMEKDGYISLDEKIYTSEKPIELNITHHISHLNTYAHASIDEASKILNLSAKQIANGGYKIHTYLNLNKQKELENAMIEKENCDNSAIIIDVKTHGISAYLGNSNYKLLDVKRQPGSCIKPILVYAPALNENMINPETQILDEEIKIGNYKPSNVNKKFAGYISITDAVKNSINIPAIKTLSYIGIDTGKQYAEKLGIEFDEKDTSYTIALGGMTYGTNLKDLATAYTVFPNNGNFDKSTFIQYITNKDNKLVYVHKAEEKMVFREDSSYLMTNILQETAKSGTARKLSDVKNTEIASKTGTVGKNDGNIDAYNISFTPEEVIGVWYGNLNNTPQNIAGGNQPTEIIKKYVTTQNYKKNKFDVPSSITNEKIDVLEEEENHRIVLASPFTPERYTKTCTFSRFNVPNEISSNFLKSPEIQAECVTENNQIILTILTQKHIEYEIKLNDIPYKNLSEKSGIITIRIPITKNENELKINSNVVGNKNLSSTKTFKLKKLTIKNEPQKEKWYI